MLGGNEELVERALDVLGVRLGVVVVLAARPRHGDAACAGAGAIAGPGEHRRAHGVQVVEVGVRDRERRSARRAPGRGPG